MVTFSTVLTMIAIAAICVLVTDITGAMEDLAKPLIWRLLKGKTPYRNFDNHLLNCSLCQSHWLNLIYLCFANGLSIYGYLIILLIAVMTPIIKDLIYLMQDLLTKVIRLIQNLVDKL